MEAGMGPPLGPPMASPLGATAGPGPWGPPLFVCHKCLAAVPQTELERHALDAHVGSFAYWLCGVCDFRHHFPQVFHHVLAQGHDARAVRRRDHFDELLVFLADQQAFLAQQAQAQAQPHYPPPPASFGPVHSTPIHPARPLHDFTLPASGQTPFHLPQAAPPAPVEPPSRPPSPSAPSLPSTAPSDVEVPPPTPTALVKAEPAEPRETSQPARPSPGTPRSGGTGQSTEELIQLTSDEEASCEAKPGRPEPPGKAKCRKCKKSVPAKKAGGKGWDVDLVRRHVLLSNLGHAKEHAELRRDLIRRKLLRCAQCSKDVSRELRCRHPGMRFLQLSKDIVQPLLKHLQDSFQGFTVKDPSKLNLF